MEAGGLRSRGRVGEDQKRQLFNPLSSSTIYLSINSSQPGIFRPLLHSGSISVVSGERTLTLASGQLGSISSCLLSWLRARFFTALTLTLPLHTLKKRIPSSKSCCEHEKAVMFVNLLAQLKNAMEIRASCICFPPAAKTDCKRSVYNNTNLFSPSSKIGLTGLKSRCQQDCVPSESSKGELLPERKTSLKMPSSL